MATSTPSLRVLVVEDDPAVANLLQAVLRDLGLEPRITASAVEGSRWAAAEDFDLAVLDVHVEQGTGLDVARVLRTRSARTPILFSSGSWTPVQRSAAFAMPGAVMLDKPFDLIRLQDTIRRLLGGGAPG